MKPIPVLFSMLCSLLWCNSYAKQQLPTGAFWISNHWCTVGPCQQPIHWRDTLSNPQSLSINKKGLENLYSSGSASPSLDNMLWLKKAYGKNHSVYLIDLRQETHLLVNSLPVSIFYKQDAINWGKMPSQIDTEEESWSKQLAQANQVTINTLSKSNAEFKSPKDPITLPIKTMYTEAQAARIAGLGYYRLYVPDYHPPTPAQVDYFISIVHALPLNAWLHFHCAAGKGRTTTFMVMRDMLVNAKQLPLEDIVTRQASIGGIDLFNASKSSLYPWKSAYHAARRDFLKLFYRYVRSEAYPGQSFTTWVVRQPKGDYKLLLNSAAYKGFGPSKISRRSAFSRREKVPTGG
jgi:protein-tyrosine phosphatase